MNINLGVIELRPDEDDEKDLKKILEGGTIRSIQVDEQMGNIILRVMTPEGFLKVTFGSRQDDSICYIEKLI